MVDAGCIPQKIYGGWVNHLPIRMVNWTAVRPPTQSNRARLYSEPIGLVTVNSTSSSFTSIFKISISLVRPLDPLLGLRPWSPLGDFRLPGYLSLCVNPFPQSYRAADATAGGVHNFYDAW